MRAHVILTPNHVVADGQGGAYYNGTFSAITQEDGSLVLIKSIGSIPVTALALSNDERQALQRWFRDNG